MVGETLAETEKVRPAVAGDSHLGVRGRLLETEVVRYVHYCSEANWRSRAQGPKESKDGRGKT